MIKFTTIAEAKRVTGLSYLGSVASSSKIAKGLEYNEMTYVLYLAPADMSGKYNVCPLATKECKEACLSESGRNRMDVKRNMINNARIKKTKLFFEEQDFFMSWLATEIQKAKSDAKKLGYRFSVRLNGTSDISMESFKMPDGKNLLDVFSDVPFYDYTKVANRFKLLNKFNNYDLTYSFSGSNMPECVNILSTGKGRVAMVFEGKELPISFAGYPVIDGDAYDMRYLDENGVIVGLKFKKVRNKIDTSNNKFIIPKNSSLSVYA